MLKDPVQSPVPPANSDCNRRILLVDDDVDLLRVSQVALEWRNYEVLTLSNCRDLLEKIKEFQPKLIFMDHCMPDMSGLVATRLIKSHKLCKHIPVIYFSASPSIAELARQAGADDWLSKPFRIDDIRNKADKFFHLAPIAEPAISRP